MRSRAVKAFDYVADFGAQLPANVIAMLLGVPESDRPHVRETIDAIFHLEPGAGMVNDVSLQAMATLHSYCPARSPNAVRIHATTCSPTSWRRS